MKSGYAFVLATVALTVYGQLVIKWQVDRAGDIPSGTGDRVRYAVDLFSNPWVISSFAAAVVAALAYMVALSKLDLSRAYPVMSLSFAFVLLLSAAFFAESITVPKVLGIALILAGVAIGVRF